MQSADAGFSPLYDCPECGEQTTLPEKLDYGTVVNAECPYCGNDTMMCVDGLCRVGRTVAPHRDPCWEEWEERWPDEVGGPVREGALRLCPEHYERFQRVELPDGAIGLCEEDECRNVVWELTDEDEFLCDSCR